MSKSAHDISEGGLFIALLESGMAGNLGFNIETDNNFRKDAYLFGESQSRIIISVQEDNEDQLVNYLNSNNIPFTRLGEVAGDHFIIDEEDYGPISEWKNVFENQLEELIEEHDE